MIHITYSAGQADLANQIRNDISKSNFQTAYPLLLVLVSDESNADPSVQEEIQQATLKGIRIIPILTEQTTLPIILDEFKPLNFSGGYKRQPLMTRLSQSSMTPDDVKQANRRALIVIGGIAVVMFVIAIFGIMSGMVAFPVKEYNEEATFQAQMIDGLVHETLEYVKPKTTQDALNYEPTLEAVPTRLYYFARGTATALPSSQGD